MIPHNKINEQLEIGKVYGDVTVVECIDRKSNNLRYKVKCNICGTERIVWLKDIKKLGNTHKNCVKALPKDSTTKRLRTIWSHMVDRCTNSNCEMYKHYGARGIKTQYEFFIDFYLDFIDSYIEHCEKHGEKNTSIDRIDVNGDYVKDNMRWATLQEQKANKRKTIVEATNGVVTITGSVKDIYTNIPCDKSCVYDCINGKIKTIKGYTIKVIEKPLTTRE